MSEQRYSAYIGTILRFNFRSEAGAREAGLLLADSDGFLTEVEDEPNPFSGFWVLRAAKSMPEQRWQWLAYEVGGEYDWFERGVPAAL